MDDDLDDIFELEADTRSIGVLPSTVMEKSFYGVHNRNWKTYLASIEWDTWCKPLDPKTILAQIREHEHKTHPFNKYF